MKHVVFGLNNILLYENGFVTSDKVVDKIVSLNFYENEIFSYTDNILYYYGEKLFDYNIQLTINFPNLIVSQIAGVQPMNGPTGKIFTLKPRYKIVNII